MYWFGILVTILPLFSQIVSHPPAKNDTLKLYHMNEYIVTEKSDLSPVTTSTYEINVNQLRTPPFGDVSDIIETYPAIYKTVGTKNEAAISIRGFDQKEISVMLDGIPIYIPYSGEYDLSSISANSVKKIKIINNTGSVIYGPNTMGGVINIITEIKNKNELSLNLSTDNTLSKNISINLNGIYKRLTVNMFTNYVKTDGYNLPANFNPDLNEDGGIRNNSDYEKTQLFLRAVYAPHNAGIFNINTVFLLNKKGIPPEVGSTHPKFWRFTHWDKKTFSISWDKQFEKTMLQSDIFYDGYYNILDAYDDSTYYTQNKPGSFHSTYDDFSLGGNILCTRKSSSLETRFALHYKKDFHNAKKDYSSEWEEYVMQTASCALENDFKITRNLIFSTGIAYNYLIPVYANGSALRSPIGTFDPLVSILLSPDNKTNYHISFTGKTRFPTLKELYSEYLGSSIRNPNLKNEYSYNYEIGLSHTFSSFCNSEIALYDSELRNLIEKTLVDSVYSQEQNIGKARYKGATLSTDIRFANILITFSYNYLSAYNLTDNAPLQYRANHRFNLAFTYKLPYDLTFFINFNFTGKRYYEDRQTHTYNTLPTYTITDVKITKLFSHGSICLSSDNIFDNYYERVKGYPAQGRNFNVKFSVNI